MMRFAPLLVFAGLAILLVFSLSAPHTQKLPSSLPAFNVPLLSPGNNNQTFSNASIAGKPAIVHFFASWCSSCLAEHPLIIGLSKQTRIPIYGIAWKDPPEKTQQWLKKYGNPYQTIANDQSGEAVIAFGSKGVPETFIVDSQGAIVFHNQGPLTESTINNDIKPLTERLSNAP